MKVEAKANGETTVRECTAKEEAFARAFVECHNQCEAYRRSYSTGNMSQGAVEVEACRVAQRPNVSLRIAELQAEASERNDITVDFLTKEYREAIKLAKDTNSATGLTGAITALGKLHGLIVEKKQVESDNRHHHSAEPVSAFDEFLTGIAGEPPEKPSKESVPN